MPALLLSLHDRDCTKGCATTDGKDVAGIAGQRDARQGGGRHDVWLNDTDGCLLYQCRTADEHVASNGFRCCFQQQKNVQCR